MLFFCAVVIRLIPTVSCSMPENGGFAIVEKYGDCVIAVHRFQSVCDVIVRKLVGPGIALHFRPILPSSMVSIPHFRSVLPSKVSAIPHFDGLYQLSNNHIKGMGPLDLCDTVLYTHKVDGFLDG